MHSAYGKAIEVAEGNGVCLFVHFDFMFFSMRVHSGHDPIHWEGQEWQGIGDILRQDASSNWIILSSQLNERGRMSASLPMSQDMREILSEEYYRDCKMQWMLCTVNADGGVERRVCINEGRIFTYTKTEDSVTFTAQSEFLDSQRDRDGRHKDKVKAIRQRFGWDLMDAIVSSGVGWMVSVAEMMAGTMGFIVDVFEVVIPGRNRRMAKQRWAARRRTYWFKTEPRIPGLRMRRNGYKVRADTLDEAKARLYELVASSVWDISPSFVSMVIYWNDCPLEFLNLDKIRQNDGPKRHEQTTRMRVWPP